MSASEGEFAARPHRPGMDLPALQDALFALSRAPSPEAGAACLPRLSQALGRTCNPLSFSTAALPELLESWFSFPATRLAVYGTLAPGEENDWVLRPLRGEWSPAIVRGRRHAAGWGYTHGFPALVYDPGGDPVSVQVFHSLDLPAHWPRLDRFEGDAYRRILVPVEQNGSVLVANLYALQTNAFPDPP